MWKVLVSERFYKDLEKALKGLSEEETRNILQKLDELAEELHITPYPAHKFVFWRSLEVMKAVTKGFKKSWQIGCVWGS